MKDEDGFSSFVRDHGSALLRTSRMLVRETADAEDVLQTALLRLSRRWPVEHPQAYMRRTLVNLTRDRHRRRHLVPTPYEGLEHTSSILPDLADAHAAQAALEHLLQSLPAKQRAAVVLRVLEGLSEAETARALGCSPGTVGSNLSRGLSRLRSVLPEGVSREF